VTADLVTVTARAAVLLGVAGARRGEIGMPIGVCRTVGLVATAILVVVTGSGGGPGALWAAAVAMPKWATFDAAHHLVSFTVIAAQGGVNGTLNFNGYANGQLTVTVPVGWQVHVDFVNSGAGALPHSFEVIRNVKPIPPQGIPPAIPRAETDDLVDGIDPNPPNNKGSADFTATSAGRYLWFCGVPTHGLSGMWDNFVVSAAASLPSVTVKK